MKSVLRKLRSNAGESIAETLVALAVSVFGITLLALMIQASSNLVRSSNIKIQEYVQSENALNEKTGSSASGQVSLTDSGNTPIKFTGDDEHPYVEVEFYEMSLGNRTIMTYKKR